LIPALRASDPAATGAKHAPEKNRGGSMAAPKVAEKRFPGGIPMTMPSATRSNMLHCNISIMRIRMQDKILHNL
jgi:hypothetical protein